MYLSYIHYFRAVAITLIVLGHAISIGHWRVDTWWSKLTLNAVSNATVYFVFISGFLFHHIYAHAFNFRKFLTTRIKNVLCPYLALSAIPIALILVTGYRQPLIPDWYYTSRWYTLFFFLFTGCTFQPFWYIPMAMLLYLLATPIVALSRSIWFPMVIGALLTLACVVHRPMFNLNTFHAFVYFLPVYLLGIWASGNKEWLLPWIEKHVLFLAAGGGFFTVLQTSLSPVVGNFHKYLLQTGPLDINLPAKILFTGVTMAALRRLEHKNLPLLNAIADYSFPIYFLHSILLELIDRLSLWPFSDNFPQVLLLTLFLMAVSVVTAMAIKLLLGKNSRYFIGY